MKRVVYSCFVCAIFPINAMFAPAANNDHSSALLSIQPPQHPSCVLLSRSSSPPLKLEEKFQSPVIDIEGFLAADAKSANLLSQEVRLGKYVIKIHSDLESVGELYLRDYVSKNTLNLKSVDTNKKSTYFELGGSQILLFEESDARRTVGSLYRVGVDYFQQFISRSNRRLDVLSESCIAANSEYLVFRKRIDYGVTPTSSFCERNPLMIHMLYFCNFSIGNTDYVHH
ncbi:MAG: hypothetical protein LBJ77_03500 [Holosporales bacterium]|nr:hypothetical protein [Holosporales bacterium]